MHTSVVPYKKLIAKRLFSQIQAVIPIVTVDLAIFRRHPETNKPEILLIKRRIYPEVGKWCLVGGRLLKGERFRDAIIRQLQREFGVKGEVIKPWSSDKPIAVNNNPKADPQKHYVSMLYPITLIGEISVSSGPEWSEAKWFPIGKLPKSLGFNHEMEIAFAVRKLRQTKFVAY